MPEGAPDESPEATGGPAPAATVVVVDGPPPGMASGPVAVSWWSIAALGAGLLAFGIAYLLLLRWLSRRARPGEPR